MDHRYPFGRENFSRREALLSFVNLVNWCEKKIKSSHFAQESTKRVFWLRESFINSDELFVVFKKRIKGTRCWLMESFKYFFLDTIRIIFWLIFSLLTLNFEAAVVKFLRATGDRRARCDPHCGRRSCPPFLAYTERLNFFYSIRL